MRSGLLVSGTVLITACSVTPEMLSKQAVLESAQRNLHIIEQNSAEKLPIVDLSYAIARSINYNYERKLKTLESVLENTQLQRAAYEQLPSMAASAGYSLRSNYAASASTTFTSSSPDPLPASPAYSVSQDRSNATTNVGFAWNVLDFGLSYVRAKQQADKYLIAQERERKVIHNITKEVRTAYYRAVSAQKLLDRIQPLMKRADAALASSRQIEALRAEPPLEALSYQRSLLEVLRTLQSLRQDLSTSKNDLARLMGIKPGTEFDLALITDVEMQDQTMGVELQCLENTALLRRPELMETRYRERISAEETRAALLKLLPGISLNAGYNYDNSDYLLNNDWANYGAKVSWNLFNIFSLEKEQELAELKQELAKQQTLATSMAVLSQVHIAGINFAESRENFKIAKQYLEVSDRIAEQTKNANQVRNIGELKLIREELNQILAELRRDVAYATMQNYFGEIITSVGIELVGDEYKTMDVELLAQNVGKTLNDWQSNSFVDVNNCAL